MAGPNAIPAGLAAFVRGPGNGPILHRRDAAVMEQGAVRSSPQNPERKRRP